MDTLVHNLILAESPWLWNINYQGIEYDGVRVPQNKSFIYGATDQLFTYIGLPPSDYKPFQEQILHIEGITCGENYDYLN